MLLKGTVYAGDGMTISTKAMHTQMAILNVHTQNIANFGIPGWQRKEAVVTSFAEHLGPNGVQEVTTTEIGRLRKSGGPLDLALASKGYFQKINAMGGVELTRDGRFKLDEDGSLRALDGKRILSASGVPVRLTVIPDDLEKGIKFSPNGDINVYDEKKGQMITMGRLAVASETGGAADTVDVKQGYVEDSNISLQEEFVSIIPLRRQFEANRQMFIIQSDAMSRMVQELGRTQ